MVTSMCFSLWLQVSAVWYTARAKLVAAVALMHSRILEADRSGDDDSVLHRVREALECVDAAFKVCHSCDCGLNLSSCWFASADDQRSDQPRCDVAALQPAHAAARVGPLP
jgi:hypothetical protein